MKVFRLAAGLAVAAAVSVPLSPTASAQGLQDEVTITNRTRGQPFSPVFVGTHGAEARFFEPGRPTISQFGHGGRGR